jgi:transposase
MTINANPPRSLEEAMVLIQEMQWQISSLTAAFERELRQARWQIEALKKQLYGPSKDRAAESVVSREQVLMDLFPAPGEPPATRDVVFTQSTTQEEKKSSHPRRCAQPRVMETVTERIEPEEKTCPHCGQAKHEMGCERSERYEYVPAKIIRHEILRPKLSCKCPEGTISIAPLPSTPIAQGIAGASLLSHVCLSKYLDHLPLDRQRKQLERLGLVVTRQTLCDWVNKGAECLEPIVRLMKARLQSGSYVQVDETPVRVIDPDRPGGCVTGWLWVMGVPGGDVVFEYHPGRGKDYALELLGGFSGTLQRDGYGVYGSIVRDNSAIIPAACLAHARRKFIDAQVDDPQQAQWFIGQILKLYLVEQHARQRGMTAGQRLALRQEKSAPLWAEIKERLHHLEGSSLLAQSPLGKAVRYMLNEWDALQTHLRDGRVEIDNNLTENAIRPSALGKKNWLFIGHPDAGWRSAVFYSIVVSCQRHGIDVAQYLNDVFTRVPAMQASQLPQLLPENWKLARQNAPQAMPAPLPA